MVGETCNVYSKSFVFGNIAQKCELHVKVKYVNQTREIDSNVI